MNRRYVYLVLLAMSYAALCTAGSSEEARKILLESENRHRTKAQEYAGELVVVSKDGKERRKSWKSFREGYAGDSRQLIRFTDPPEVRGVGFLSIGHPGKNPDQWLYLPSMKRERRIASQDRNASFVGTDFNYEDLEELDQSKYEVSMLPETTMAGQTCVVIEAVPKDRSVYDRKVLTLRKDILYLLQMECYRKGETAPSKRLLLSDFQQTDSHWIAKKMEMADLKKGSHTTVLLKDIALDRPQPADRFTIQNLNREGAED